MKNPVLLAALMALVAAAHAANDPPQVRMLAANCANCHGTLGRTEARYRTSPACRRRTSSSRWASSGWKTARDDHASDRQGYSDRDADLLADYFARQSPGR